MNYTTREVTESLSLLERLGSVELRRRAAKSRLFDRASMPRDARPLPLRYRVAERAHAVLMEEGFLHEFQAGPGGDICPTCGCLVNGGQRCPGE